MKSAIATALLIVCLLALPAYGQMSNEYNLVNKYTIILKVYPIVSGVNIDYPRGLCISDNIVYVADTNNHRLIQYDNNFHYLKSSGKYGIGLGDVIGPAGMSLDSDGNLVVAEASGDRIQILSPDLEGIRIFGSGGVTSGHVRYPSDLMHDKDGNMYLVDHDNYRIQKFDRMLRFVTMWGEEGNENGLFNRPNNIAINSAGNIFITETFQGRIQVFTNNGQYIRNILGPNNLRMKWRYSSGLTFDRDQYLHVFDGTSGNVHVYDKQLRYVNEYKCTEARSEFTYGPVVMKVSNNNLIYICNAADNSMAIITSSNYYVTKGGSKIIGTVKGYDSKMINGIKCTIMLNTEGVVLKSVSALDKRGRFTFSDIPYGAKYSITLAGYSNEYKPDKNKYKGIIKGNTKIVIQFAREDSPAGSWSGR